MPIQPAHVLPVLTMPQDALHWLTEDWCPTALVSFILWGREQGLITFEVRALALKAVAQTSEQFSRRERFLRINRLFFVLHCLWVGLTPHARWWSPHGDEHEE